MDTKQQWTERKAAMEADADFMAWLEKYLPDQVSANSGGLFSMHDAFRAGAQRHSGIIKSALLEGAKAYRSDMEEHGCNPDEQPSVEIATALALFGVRWEDTKVHP